MVPLMLLVTAAPQRYTDSQLAMEVTNLPGIPANTTFKQFAGYVPVSSMGSVFFWFVESQGSPTEDPVALWTNGGPGCSGLTGFLTEHGPFRPLSDGTLKANPFAWNKLANMVYVEQPIGVGFSPVSGTMNYNDSQAAADNLEFVAGFFKLFPQFAKQDFYITSESYGGHYMPTLAEAIVASGGRVPNFKGFLVGNPLTYLTNRNYGEFATYYGHQLLPKPLWDAYLAASCKDAPGLDPGPACANITNLMEGLVKDLDPYGLDFPKCADSPLAVGMHERWTLRSVIRPRANGRKGPPPNAAGRNGAPAPYPYFPRDYEPCASDWAADYLSRKDVQAAIHAKPGGVTWTGNWSACSNNVSATYSQTDVAAPMMPVYQRLVAKGGLKMTIFSGDDDAVCATRGTQQWIWDLGLPVKTPWTPWMMDDGPGCPRGPACRQVGGYITRYDGLNLVTVHGAGHLVPATRPAAGLVVLRNYLLGVF